jgi:hypothetical protein
MPAWAVPVLAAVIPAVPAPVAVPGVDDENSNEAKKDESKRRKLNKLGEFKST